MIGHYLTVAFRNFCKYKLQTFISIVGLAIGLVSFTYGMKWLEYETSYDGFYPQSKQIYTLYGISKQTGKIERKLPAVLAYKLKQEFPEISEITQVYPNARSFLVYNGEPLEMPEQLFIDKHFFTFFPPKIVCGRQSDLLHSNDEIVVTRSFAIRHFNSPEDALGKVLQSAYKNSLTVVAVIEDAPVNSTFKKEVFELDLFSSEINADMTKDELWQRFDNEIYLLLEKNIDPDAFEKKLYSYLAKYDYMSTLSVKMIPLTDIRHTFGSELSFNLSYIRTFSITTLLLLLCVFFNFANLLLNRIYQRSKEMKLRNAIGSGKYRLVIQLLIELTLQAGIAIILACCILELTASLFCRSFEAEIVHYELFTNLIRYALLSWGLLILITFPLLLHFVGNSSLVVSGGISPSHKSLFRKVSMIFQLAICVFFLMTTFVMFRQISFMRHKDLGFCREGLIHFNTGYSSHRSEITHDIASLSTIEQLLSANLSIEHSPNTTNRIEWAGKEQNYNPDFQFIQVGENFQETFKTSLLEGRFCSENDIDGSNRFLPCNTAVINEEAVRVLGLNDPIGTTIDVSTGSSVHKEMKIVGIIKNFHGASLRNPILPMIISLHIDKWNGYFYYARVSSENEKAAIRAINEVFRKYDQETEVRTMTDVFNLLNKSEDASLQLFSLLAILCTLISVFGLYSVSSSNILQRRREVAVRKVMGANSLTIIRMFFKEYLTIVLVANIIALPLSWLFMYRWLEQYPYRIGIGFWMYLVVLVLTGGLIICTVLYQTLKAAETNPAEVIKNE